MKCVDVHNVYINAKPKERVWFSAGQDFCIHKVKVVVVTRELYSMKGSGSVWALVLRKLIRDLSFTPYRDDGYL